MVATAAVSRRAFAALLVCQAAVVAIGGRFAESFVQIDCPIRSMTGWQCPGCGSTRCVSALGIGDVAAGFRHNPLLTAATVSSLTLSFVGVLSPSLAQHVLSSIAIRRQLLTGLLIATIVFFILLRNII